MLLRRVSGVCVCVWRWCVSVVEACERCVCVCGVGVCVSVVEACERCVCVCDVGVCECC